MINLYDTHKRHLGTITEAQLQFLIDSMEEESTTDQDYYIEPATLDYLEPAARARSWSSSCAAIWATTTG